MMIENLAATNSQQPQSLKMANPNGIYEPHSSNAAINAEKLGYRPALGLTITVEQKLSVFNTR